MEAEGVSNLHHLFRNSLILQAAYPGLAQKKHPTWGASLGGFYTVALCPGCPSSEIWATYGNPLGNNRRLIAA